VSYLNWLPNRPYTGGDKYNCLQIIAELDTANTSTTLLNQAKVGDEKSFKIIVKLLKKGLKSSH